MTAVTVADAELAEVWRFAPMEVFGPLRDRDLPDVQAMQLVDGDDVTFTNDGTDAAMKVEVADGAHARLVIDLIGSDAGTLKCEIVTGRDSTLKCVFLGELEAQGVRLVEVQLRPGAASSVQCSSVALSGRAYRHDVQVMLDAPGAQVELLGLSFGADQDYLEQRLRVEHAAAHARSNIVYKSVASDDAHLVWVGDVMVRPEGVGADTYEMNRNLVLSRTARVDSVPNLELETGEVVRAGHASATGRFDDEQLFYLQSRGIPADIARRMVVEGFVAELIPLMGLGEHESRIARTIERRLESV